MTKLILVRRGESIWNLENKFTGWTDVELSKQGIKEAKYAGKILKENNFHFNIAYTSVLKRSKDTLKYILKEMNQEDIEIKSSWKLNERHYKIQKKTYCQAKKFYTMKRVVEYWNSFILLELNQ